MLDFTVDMAHTISCAAVFLYYFCSKFEFFVYFQTMGYSVPLLFRIYRRFFMDTDVKYMKKALAQARRALALGEVPIGCVIVSDGKVIARGYNRRNHSKTTLAHAEISAIDKASKKLGDWRLEGCTMYVTLEPCQMCAGAIVQARIDRVVIATMNPKAGCCGSIINLLNMKEFNHQVEITTGVCLDESVEIMQEFFTDLRRRNKAEKLAGKIGST